MLVTYTLDDQGRAVREIKGPVIDDPKAVKRMFGKQRRDWEAFRYWLVGKLLTALLFIALANVGWALCLAAGYAFRMGWDAAGETSK